MSNKSESSGSRMTVLAAVLGVVSAVLAVATAVLGYQTAVANSEKDTTRQAAAADADTIANLQNQIKGLQGENDRLKAAATATATAPVSAGPTGGPTASPLPQANFSQRHAGQVTILPGTEADLDAPSSNPQWRPGTPDIQVFNNRLTADGGAQLLSLGTVKAGYDTCRNTTGYSSNAGFALDSTSPGAYFCVFTHERRYSAMRILKAGNNLATLDVVTFDPPDAS